MATRTGRLVVHPKTGEMVEELKEDQMMVALYDPVCDKPEDHSFQRVLRSDFKLNRINELFNCNAALLKDPFGNVIWPKDWMTQVLPPAGKDKWFYIIHERLEPPPQDDLKDPMYAGKTVLVLTGVPKDCEATDLKTWLLFGITQDYEPLVRVREEIHVAERKRQLLRQKLNALPSIEVDGTPEQQTEMRKKLSTAIASHTAKYDQEVTGLTKKKARIEKFLLTEPLDLTPLPIDKPAAAANDREETMDQYAKRVETRTWTVAFTSSRGDDLSSVALKKSDWNYVCLVKTRPQPKAYVEDDQVQNNIISENDLRKEINMRTVRLRRLRHGQGERLGIVEHLAQKGDDGDVLKPWDQGFHVSTIGSMYSGEWYMGHKQGYGREFTNVGIYEGEFDRDQRQGRGKIVYGKGTTITGTFEHPGRQYEYSKKFRERVYPQSLLNGDMFRDGVEQGEHMNITFPDGATYVGEMKDGKITGWGTYTSSTGVVDEGHFQDGLLHGDDCTRRFPDGTTHSGTFSFGVLHGRGRLFERDGDRYDGFFDLGVKSGRGTSHFDRGRCRHVGFWFENMMNGRGDCVFTVPDEGVAEKTSRRNVGATIDDDGDWDYLYEGSFLQGDTQAKHRHVDLKQTHHDHLPFTTNGKSVEKMPFLTQNLPDKLKTLERRRLKNNSRRMVRERDYLKQQEFANLSLYYALLDEFYEKWIQQQRENKEDSTLDDEDLERVQEERAAAIEFIENRLKFRKEKYDLSPRKRELAMFESYLERVTLTERVKLNRALNWELSAMTTDIEQTAKGFRKATTTDK